MKLRRMSIFDFALHIHALICCHSKLMIVLRQVGRFVKKAGGESSPTR